MIVKVITIYYNMEGEDLNKQKVSLEGSVF